MQDPTPKVPLDSHLATRNLTGTAASASELRYVSPEAPLLELVLEVYVDTEEFPLRCCI